MAAIKKLSVLTLLLFSFTMFVGCGGDEGKIKSTAKKYFKAMEKGDFKAAGKCLCKKSKEEFDKTLENKEMKAFMEEMTKAMFAEAKPKFGEVKIDGDKATIKVTMKMMGKESTDDIPLVKEGGKWLIQQ